MLLLEKLMDAAVVRSNFLENLLLELQDSSTTPEKALQSLSYTWLLSGAYHRVDEEPVVIFLAYIRFITTRLSDGCVEGIWGEILRKTLKYFNCSVMIQQTGPS